jgi:hypothetical protein
LNVFSKRVWRAKRAIAWRRHCALWPEPQSWAAGLQTGSTLRPMKGGGIEFIEMRDDKCAHWEATFNAWDAEGPRNSLFT